MWSKAIVMQVLQQWSSVIIALWLQLGVSRPGDKDRGGQWGKAPAAKTAGGQAPMKQTSWGMAWAVKPRG
jgi:hypothetical protein